MENLASYLINAGALKTPMIIRAFDAIDRKDFVPPEFLSEAYADHPLPIGFGQTISQPYTVAFVLELLQAARGQIVLDVGAGSGWQTGLLASIVGERGQVLAIEIIPELLKRARKNLEKYHFKNITFMVGNAHRDLLLPLSFDQIVVAAASEKVPENLLRALKIGGRMVLPIGRAGSQDIVCLEKTSVENFSVSHFPGFMFVPLVKDR